MVQKFPEKVSRNSGNYWISEMPTIQPKILEIPRAKLNGKKTSGKIWVYLVRLSYFFLEILENAVPFATGSCQKFKPEVLVECKALKILPQKKRSVWSLRYYLQTKMSIQITTRIWISGNCMAKLIYFSKITNLQTLYALEQNGYH